MWIQEYKLERGGICLKPTSDDLVSTLKFWFNTEQDKELSGAKHSGQMECNCGHQLGKVSFPLDKTFTHMNGTCVWTCCGASWEKSKCKTPKRPSSGTIVSQYCGGCQHENVTKKCMICTNCLECTGFGSSCVHHKPGRTAGQECGCGFGKSGCAKCGMCQKCQRNAAIVQKGARLSVGDLVTLTKTYADFGDASEGPLKPGPASNSRSVMSKHTRMHACGSCRLNCMTIVIFILNLEPYTSNLALAMDKDSSVRPMTFSFSCSFLLLRRCRHNTKG
jgi:hypothetical protein